MIIVVQNDLLIRNVQYNDYSNDNDKLLLKCNLYSVNNQKLNVSIT